VLLSSNGKLTLEAEDVKPSTPIPVALAKTPIDSSDPFLRDKTSRREVYERVLTAHPNVRMSFSGTSAAN
jgi:para-aminobenzoate synthetase/4-amino-4-deoxychorismate lyase